MRIERRNIGGVPVPGVGSIGRSALMGLRVDRLVGLDLYVTARR